MLCIIFAHIHSSVSDTEEGILKWESQAMDLPGTTYLSFAIIYGSFTNITSPLLSSQKAAYYIRIPRSTKSVRPIWTEKPAIMLIQPTLAIMPRKEQKTQTQHKQTIEATFHHISSWDIVSLAHNISFWGQKLNHNVSFWPQKYCWPILTISGPKNCENGSA